MIKTGRMMFNSPGSDDGRERWSRYPALMERLAVALMVLSALGILVFTVLKAYKCSFTHDESLTWSRYVHLPFSDLLSHKESFTNNHMLNSILMKWTESAFGSSELALRLPNLLALVIYLIYGALLVRPFGPVLDTLSYVCLCYGANIMELFGLARGYGLSYCFMMMAQYHAWRSLVTGRPLHVVLMHAGLVLAVLSSFVVLQYAAALVVVLPLVALMAPPVSGEGGRSFLRAMKAHAVLVPLSVLAVWEPLRRVSIGNKFDFGGGHGFFEDTFTSLTYSAFPAISITSTDALWIWYVFLSASVLVIGYFTFERSRKRPQAEWPGHLPSMLAWGALLGTMLVIVVQHAVLGTQYPVARFGKFLFPLAVLATGALASGAARYRLFWPTAALMAWAAFASVRTFCLRTTFTTSNEWQYDMDTKAIMRVIRHDLLGQGTETAPVTLGHPWLLGPTIGYYKATWSMHRLQPGQFGEGSSYNEDYLVMADSMLAGFDSSLYHNAGHFENASLWLYRK